MSFYRALLLIIALLSLPLCGQAQDDSFFKGILWSPAQLASGSPCLLTVEFQNPPDALQGEWFGHDVGFFPSRSRTTWYALAGADVETAPGIYALTLRATMPDGRSLTTIREIPIEPSHYKQVELQVAKTL